MAARPAESWVHSLPEAQKPEFSRIKSGLRDRAVPVAFEGLLELNPCLGFWNSRFIWVAAGCAAFFFTTNRPKLLQADVLELTPLREISFLLQKSTKKINNFRVKN